MQPNDIWVLSITASALVIYCILMVSMFKSNKKKMQSIFDGNLDVKPPKKNIIYSFEKRVTDIIFSSIVLITLSPIIILLALLIKLEDHGKITYKRYCVGYKGNTISYRLFRTMRPSTIETDSEHIIFDTEREVNPRITKMGFFLRKTGLDYIPMFLSVLSGKLTVIGLSRKDPQNISESHKGLFQYEKPGMLALSMISKQEGQPIDQETADRVYLQSRKIFSDIEVMLYAINNTYVTMARNTDIQINNNNKQSADNNPTCIINQDSQQNIAIPSEHPNTISNAEPSQRPFVTTEPNASDSFEYNLSEENDQIVNQYKKKLSYLNKAIEESPNASLFYRRSAAEYKLGQYTNALLDINKAIQIDPKASLFSKRASIYISNGQYNEALVDLNKAIAMAPSESVIRKRAALYALIGNHQEALKDLNTAESFTSKNKDYKSYSTSNQQ